MRSFAGAADATGAGISGLCILHCLALPVAASALPMLGVFREAEWVHVVLFALAAPIAVLALARSGVWPMTLGLLGLVLLALGTFGPAPAETPASALGGLLLIVAHVANWRRRHRGGAVH